MNHQQRADLADTLARLVADGSITEEQAIAVYFAVADDSALLDNALPLPPYAGIAAPAAQDDNALWLLVAAAVGASLLRGANTPATVDRMPQRQRIAGADRLQDWHAESAARLARDLAAGSISVAEFQRRMLQINNQHNAAQVALGAGSRYRQAVAGIAAETIRQAAYLQRFADVAAGHMLRAAAGMGQPLTLGQLAERAAMYGGIGRALFFQALEQYRQTDNGAGWIVRYEARDDDRTCSPCHQAQGYYLPGTGPYPGQVCLGGHRCRCRRIAIFDPVRYAELTGAPAGAMPL